MAFNNPFDIAGQNFSRGLNIFQSLQNQQMRQELFNQQQSEVDRQRRIQDLLGQAAGQDPTLQAFAQSGDPSQFLQAQQIQQQQSRAAEQGRVNSLARQALRLRTEADPEKRQRLFSTMLNRAEKQGDSQLADEIARIASQDILTQDQELDLAIGDALGFENTAKNIGLLKGKKKIERVGELLKDEKGFFYPTIISENGQPAMQKVRVGRDAQGLNAQGQTPDEESKKKIETSFRQALDKGEADSFIKRRDQYVDAGVSASEKLFDVEQMLFLLDQIEGSTGGLVNIAKQKLARQFGIEDVDRELFNDKGKIFALQLMSDTLTGPTTDFEFEQFQDLSARIGRSKDVNRALLEDMKNLYKRRLELSREAQGIKDPEIFRQFMTQNALSSGGSGPSEDDINQIMQARPDLTREQIIQALQ